MKKQIICGVALLSLLAAGCSNEDVMNNDNEITTGKAIAIQANIANGTRMSYNEDAQNKVLKFNWSDSESFNLYQGTSSTATAFSKSTQGNIFTGVVPTDGAGTYYAVYGENITNTDGVLDIDISNQKGNASTDNGITTFMLAQATNLNQSNGLIPLFDFKHKLAVLKLTLILPDDETGTTASRLTISGMHKKASYKLSDANYVYTDANNGIITVNNGSSGFTISSDHKITAYVAVFPETVRANQVTIRVYVGTNEYYYTITTAKTLVASQVMPVNVTLVKYLMNFKSAYSLDDYKKWSDDNCRNAVSYDDLCKYIGAGTYYDEGKTSGNGYYNGNVQTFKTPDGVTCKKGLWMMKMEYINKLSSLTPCENLAPIKGRPAASEINKYFFLPAAESKYYSDFYAHYHSNGIYWSSTRNGDYNAYAYTLTFSNEWCHVEAIKTYSNYSYLVMVAE